MKIKPEIWIVIVGVSLGFIFYSLNEPNKTILGIRAMQVSYLSLILGALAGSFLIEHFILRSAPKTTLFVSLSMIIGVIILIFYDSIYRQVPHNLFPLEIIVSSIVIFLSAFAGAFLSKIIQTLKKNYDQKT